MKFTSLLPSFAYRLSLSMSVLLVVCQAYAQFDEIAVDYSDHALLMRFPYSEISKRVLLKDINYRIVLGGLQRVRGEVIPEDALRVRGDVTKITYEVSQEFTGQDVYEHFREELVNRDYVELFGCEGRACGSSNYWANDIFRNRVLYGPERNQFYMAFRSNTDVEVESETYFALYIITRGNKKIYAHLEILEPGGATEPEPKPKPKQSNPVISLQQEQQVGDTEEQMLKLLQRLQQQKSIVITGVQFQADDQLEQGVNLSVLISLLNLDPSLSVYVVSHLREDSQPLSRLIERSNTRATAVKQALIAAGIEEARVVAAGVGPLAPHCTTGNCDQRIELVLR